MWYLKSQSDHRVLYVVPNRDVIIGRSTDGQICNFAIPEDASISRKHAVLNVYDGTLFLHDLGSRYGTFINESSENVEANSKIKLNQNDIVKFGKISSVWKVCHINLTTCTSTLKGENLQSLKTVLSNLGGNFSYDWDERCTYLTMPAITLTIKVVQALVQGSHIVTTKFWDKCLEAVNKHLTLPDPSQFLPQVVESTLNKEIVSFLPNKQRKLLFAGKKIVFFSRRQFDMYKPVLLNSCGTPLLLSECKMTKSMLSDRDTVVIQYNISNTTQESQAQKNQINDIIQYLKSKNKRPVADAEIGLAILYCSTDKYCNADFNFTLEVVKQSKAQTSSSTNVLAPESQDIFTNKKQVKENLVIDESLVATENNQISSAEGEVPNKRKLSDLDEETETSANKKLATNFKCTENVKRKFKEDCDESVSNPNKRIATGRELAEDDGLFNFVNSNDERNKSEVGEKKLNLIRPQKRKAENALANDNLFNFIESDDKLHNVDKTSHCGLFEQDKCIDEDSNSIDQVKNVEQVTSKDISCMRGAKLKELMMEDLNEGEPMPVKPYIKQEISDELQEQMSHLDLGITIVTVRGDLVVKREPIEVEKNGIQGKNFKKFKKVWPLKMQLSMASKCSLAHAGEHSSVSNTD